MHDLISNWTVGVNFRRSSYPLLLQYRNPKNQVGIENLYVACLVTCVEKERYGTARKDLAGEYAQLVLFRYWSVREKLYCCTKSNIVLLRSHSLATSLPQNRIAIGLQSYTAALPFGLEISLRKLSLRGLIVHSTPCWVCTQRDFIALVDSPQTFEWLSILAQGISAFLFFGCSGRCHDNRGNASA